MKPKNKHPEKDCCSLCEDVNKTVEKTKKKKNKKSSFWNWKTRLLIIVLFLGIWGIVRFVANTKTKSQPALTDQLIEIVKGFQSGGPQIGSLAPDFTSEDLNGNKISLSDFRDQKPVLLVFWATWCGFCAKELPDLKTFTKEHQNDVQVIVISSGEVKSTIVDYVKEKEINFMMLLDEQKEIWNSYLVRGTPNHFLIDKQGKIFTLQPGLASLDNLKTMLEMVSE